MPQLLLILDKFEFFRKRGFLFIFALSEGNFRFLVAIGGDFLGSSGKSPFSAFPANSEALLES